MPKRPRCSRRTRASTACCCATRSHCAQPAAHASWCRELTELAARFDAGERRGDGVHLREQARFELALRGDTGRALAIARRNWDVQKETADARILLEAALAAHDAASARPVLDWMRSAHVEDVQLARLAAQFNTQFNQSGGKA
ncbi:hypothetical protein [Massilia phosphatilytica]